MSTHTELKQFEVPKIGTRWKGKFTGDIVEVTDVTDNATVEYKYTNGTVRTSFAISRLRDFFSSFDPVQKTPEELLDEIRELFRLRPSGYPANAHIVQRIRDILGELDA